ncbi:MAG: helix-turn-helix domain-containing protein [Thermoguttaceae bacterium]|jgi:transcriptional regulator with XRE-family HTH domain|nr:helix-turn-helix domain-containing protein [Thermoguttaceae bacterium]
MATQGERVKELRKYLGLTQGEFADNIGVKGGVVSAWENGGAPIPPGRTLIICDAYHVNERWLKSGEGPMFMDEDGSVVGKTPRDHAEEYLFSIYERLPPDLQKRTIELCRSFLRRYDVRYGAVSEIDDSFLSPRDTESIYSADDDF